MKDKKPEDKELIKYIADSLREHSAPYQEGAWEKFASLNSPVKKIVWWPYLSGAAMLLLAGTLFFLLKAPEQTSATDQSALTAKKVTSPKREETGITTETGPIAVTPSNKRTEVKAIAGQLAVIAGRAVIKAPEKGPAITRSIVQASVTGRDKETVKEGKQSLVDESLLAGAPADSRETKEEQGDRFLKMLQREQSIAGVQSPSGSIEKEGGHELDKSKKWDLGIVLAPAVTRDRFNFGGGVEVAYHLSNRISVGTGVSMTGLGIQQPGQNQYSARESSSAAASPAGFYSNTKLASADEQSQDKQLESIRTSVVGLDIPLNFTYHLNKSFYASAGASFFAVVNETRTNVYVRQVFTNQSVNSLNGTAAVQPVVETQRLLEKTAEQPLENSNFNGFLNFSIGHRIPLSGKVKLGLEPFMKLPLGRAAKQDVNLSYGGIKLSAGF